METEEYVELAEEAAGFSGGAGDNRIDHMGDMDLDDPALRPTVDTFYFDGTMVDMNRMDVRSNKDGPTILFSMLFNTLEKLAARRESLIRHSRVVNIHLRSLVEILRQLRHNDFAGAHRVLADAVCTLLSSLEQQPTMRTSYFVNHLKPITCMLDDSRLAQRIKFREMCWRSRNDSKYVELAFSNPYRFIFVGEPKKQKAGTGKTRVMLHPFMGKYIYLALDRMYNCLYDKTSDEVQRFLAEQQMRSTAWAQRAGTEPAGLLSRPPPPLKQQQQQQQQQQHQPLNSLAMLETRSAAADDKERQLREFLDKIELPLKKQDMIEIIPTSGAGSTGNAKIQYLVIDPAGDAKLDEVDVDSADAVYISSLVRPRVLADGTFSLQIYTRLALKLEEPLDAGLVAAQTECSPL